MPEECMISLLSQTIWPWALFRSQCTVTLQVLTKVTRHVCVFNKTPADTYKSSHVVISNWCCGHSERFFTLSALLFEPAAGSTCCRILVRVCVRSGGGLCLCICAHIFVCLHSRGCAYVCILCVVVYHSCANKIFSLLLALIREGISNCVCVLGTVSSPPF